MILVVDNISRVFWFIGSV